MLRDGALEGELRFEKTRHSPASLSPVYFLLRQWPALRKGPEIGGAMSQVVSQVIWALTSSDLLSSGPISLVDGFQR